MQQHNLCASEFTTNEINNYKNHPRLSCHSYQHQSKSLGVGGWGQPSEPCRQSTNGFINPATILSPSSKALDKQWPNVMALKEDLDHG